MDKPILVAVSDEVESREALRLAVCAARVMGRPLVIAGVAVTAELVPVSPLSGWVVEPLNPDWMTEVVERHLRTLAVGVPTDVHRSTDSVIAPSVAAGVEALAARHDPEAVVLGATHHGLLTRALAGDHAMTVLRHAPCPVIVAASDPADAITATAPKRIGVAWDRGDAAADALVAALRVAALAGGRVTVVHVLEPALPVVVPPADPAMGAELLTLRQREAEEAIRVAVQAIDPGAEVDIDLRHGSRTAEVEAATEHLDLLVVGSTAKGPFRRVAVGSVSEHLVHHNHCPVVVVPRGLQVAAAA